MRKTRSSIHVKLILLEITVIATGLIIALFTYASIGSIKDNFNLLNTVNTLKINIANQDQEINNILENEQYNISMYKNNKTASLIVIRNLQNLDSSLISQLFANEYVQTDIIMNEKSIKLEDLINKYHQTYKLLIINIRDRGFETHGHMGNIFEKSNEINMIIDRVDDFLLDELVREYKNKLTEFGNHFSPEYAGQIRNASDQILSYMTSISELNPSVNINILYEKFNDLNNLISVVIGKNENIGFQDNSGILKNIKNYSSEITANLLEVTEDLNRYVPLKNKLTLNRLLIIMFIITGIIAIYVLYLLKSFTSPVETLRTFLGKLEKGLLPDAPEFKSEDELSDIGGSLAGAVESLREKTDFATELGKGNLKTTFKSISEKDTLGNALLTLQKSLQKAAEEDKKHKIDNEQRRWANEGLAKFSEILRMNNDNTEMLCDSVIKNLVKYLKASLGGIYLFNDENKEDIFLYLASTFAYDRKKFLHDKIPLGEGLIGACAREKQTIYMTDIPEDYIRITSGLGEKKPGILLIVPLNLEKEILGVLEIASFTMIEKHELEFVENLAESIASTLASAKINERTQSLLEQSQKQAVEMAEQEEEMRQNMEELQATQEESSRKESEMYGILHAINSTTYYYETSMDGTIIEMNNRMIVILEIQKDHVIGMHHSELTAMNKNSPEYISFWTELREGNSVTKIQKFESIGGHEIWLKQNYTPIFDKDGNAIKVVCISTDITETVQLEKEVQRVERDLFSKNNELINLNGTINVSYMKCEISKEGIIQDLNSNFERITGRAKKELIGSEFMQIIVADQVKSFERIWENIMSGQAFNNVIKVKTTDDSKLIKSTFKPVMNDKNILQKIIMIGESFSTNNEND